MLYSIRQHDHSLIGGKMKENKQLSSINLCTYFTLYVLKTQPGFSSLSHTDIAMHIIV